MALGLCACVIAAEVASPFAPAAPAPPQAQSNPAAPTASVAKPGEAPAAPAAKMPPPEVRAIRGRLTPPERVLEAVLWEREMDLKVPVKVDKTTGAFEVTGLRMGTYDFLIRTPWGRLEGVDLTPRLSPYDALIPPQYRTPDLGLPAPGEFSDDDRAAVRRIVHEVKRYENKITDMAVRGSADVAVALMELLMDAPFVGRKGDEVTWRIEKWTYEKKYDAWTTFRMVNLYRFRVPEAEWRTWGWQFEPALGGLDITPASVAPLVVEYAIPAAPVREKGLAGTKYPPVEKGQAEPEAPPPEQ
jgi:hypothetical protein